MRYVRLKRRLHIGGKTALIRLHALYCTSVVTIGQLPVRGDAKAYFAPEETRKRTISFVDSHVLKRGSISKAVVIDGAAMSDVVYLQNITPVPHTSVPGLCHRIDISVSRATQEPSPNYSILWIIGPRAVNNRGLCTLLTRISVQPVARRHLSPNFVPD